MNMTIQERIIEGIERSADRQWRYTKNLLLIKPEYLLTISVADALTKGFDDICGLDLNIKLEESTNGVRGDLLMKAVGWKKYFKTLPIPITRHGRVDLYVTHEFSKSSWVIELKGFDPSIAEINKEIVRLTEFAKANGGTNNCKGCYLAFPTLTDKNKWIESILANANSIEQFQFSINSKYINTGEDACDGIPAYYANCINFEASSHSQTSAQLL